LRRFDGHDDPDPSDRAAVSGQVGEPGRLKEADGLVEGPFGDRVTEQHAGQESSRLTGDRLELGDQEPTAGLEDAADLLHRS
jgi:hypothetical protein